MKPLCSISAGLAAVAMLIAVCVVASCASQGEETRAIASEDAGLDAASVTTWPDAANVEACQADRWCTVLPPVPEPVSFNGVWGMGPSDVWIVASPDLLVHWDGSDFSSIRLNTNQTIFGIWGSGPKDVWAFSTGNALWHYAGEGAGRAAWSALETDAGERPWGGPIHAMWGRSATDLWAVGPVVENWIQPTVWHANGWNGGSPQWVPTITTPEPNPWGQEPSFNAVWGNERDIWIVGDDGRTRYSAGWKDGSAAWIALDSGTSLSLYALWGIGNEVWAAGAGGVVRRFRWQSDDSIAVEEIPFPSRSTVRSLFGFAAGDIWAAGSDGTLAHWDGAAWSLVALGSAPAPSKELFAVWGSSPDDVWVVGRDTLLHKGTTLLPGTTP